MVSREILKPPAGTLTVFAFDAGQGLSEHTASSSFDATVYILDGEAEAKISGQVHSSKRRNAHNARRSASFLKSRKRFKMLLIMIKS